jgi:hypothetical protein
MLTQDRLIALLRDSAASFIDSFRATTAEQFRFKPAADRWSIAETAEHIVVVETGSGKLIRGKLLREAAAPEALAAARDGEDRIDARLVSRATTFPAPEFVRPTGRWQTPREMIDVFEESRNATIDFLLTTAVDLTRYVAPHPALGPLDGYQWAYFLARHTERHVEQIDEVKNHPDYPDL